MHLPFKILFDYPEKTTTFLLDLPPFQCFERRGETNLRGKRRRRRITKKKKKKRAPNLTHAHEHASSDIGNRMDGCK